MKITAILGAAALALLAHASAVSAATPPEETVATRFGTVSVMRKDDVTKVLYVGRRPLPVEDYLVGVENKFQVGTRDVLLVSAASGGTACPSMYAFVILEQGRAVVSDEFGNCSDLPKVVRTGDRIVVKFPGSGRSNPSVTVQLDGLQGVAAGKPLKMTALPL